MKAGSMVADSTLMGVAASCSARATADIQDRLTKGADPNERDAMGETPLFRAAQVNNVTAIAALCAAGAEVDAMDDLGATALHVAAAYRRATAVGALLAAGAAPGIADDDGWTPLHHAAAARDEKSARSLLSAGADPSSEDALGRTARDVTVDRGIAVMLDAEAKRRAVAEAHTHDLRRTQWSGL